MNLRSILYGATLVIVTACITTTVVSQEKSKTGDKDKGKAGDMGMSPEMQQEMEKKWMEFKTPGAGHKALEFKVGKWNTTFKMFTAPGGPPIESTGSTEIKWIMDGRYLSDDTKGTFMGDPFVGHGLSGYDNLKKEYFWIWIDTMGTGIMTGQGTYDAASKTFKYTSEMPDVMVGKYVKIRATERVIDNDHWISESFGAGPDGKEMKSMEIAYTRAK